MTTKEPAIRTKLSTRDIVEIRVLSMKYKFPYSMLAGLFDVCGRTIGRVVRRQGGYDKDTSDAENVCIPRSVMLDDLIYLCAHCGKKGNKPAVRACRGQAAAFACSYCGQVVWELMAAQKKIVDDRLMKRLDCVKESS